MESWQGLLSSLNNNQQKEIDMADSSEKVIISPIALIKMMKHGRQGIPMEVMGLMLGEFVDNFTTRVVDVFSMPQSGNSVSVEAVDPVYQQEMLDLLARTGRPEVVVGWYHSHPGFGCWFSGTDINTQQSFEQLNSRALGIVIDPIQSVKGNVVIDCFRLINASYLMSIDNKEPRQHTSCIGLLKDTPITQAVHGVGRQYYSIEIEFEKTREEEEMLLSLDKTKVESNLNICAPEKHLKSSLQFWEDLNEYTKQLKDYYNEEVDGQTDLEKLKIKRVGHQNPERKIRDILESNLQDLTLDNLQLQIAASTF